MSNQNLINQISFAYLSCALCVVIRSNVSFLSLLRFLNEKHRARSSCVPLRLNITQCELLKILDRDSNTFLRKIREAIRICKKRDKATNCDEGTLTLDHIYDSLLCTTFHPRKKNNNKFPRKKHWTKTLVIKPSAKMAKAKVCEYMFKDLPNIMNFIITQCGMFDLDLLLKFV